MTAPRPPNWIRQVDLLSLRIFLSAIEDGQIARAAAREHLVASAATKRIQELESLAGVELLRRSARGVEPSPAGAVLAEHIRTILATLDAIRYDMADFTLGKRGHVAVSSIRWVILPCLADEIASYARIEPSVSIDLREQPGTPEVLQSLREGSSDLAVFITVPGLDLGDLEQARVQPERLLAVLPQGHRLGSRDQVGFDELLEEDFIGFAPDAPMMLAFHAMAQRLGRPMRLKSGTHSVEVAHKLVREGFGITVLPTCALPPDRCGVRTVPLSDPWADCEITLASVRGRTLQPAAAAFRRHLIARAALRGAPPPA